MKIRFLKKKYFFCKKKSKHFRSCSISSLFEQGPSCSIWRFSQRRGLERQLNRKYCAVCACITFLSRPERAANKQTFLLVKEREKKKKKGRLHKVHQQMWPMNPNRPFLLIKRI